MSRYTFTFKKDNIFVEFTTADRDVVERQFQIWVADADNYARTHKSSASGEKTINNITENEQKEEAKPPAAEVPAEEQQQEEATEPEPVIENQADNSAETEIPAEIEEESKEEQLEEIIEEAPVFEQASTLLKTINSIQNEGDTASKNEENEAQSEPIDFESVLEKTIENPTFEPEKSKDQVFLNLIKSKATTDKFHYLMITAYYLSEFEKMERFSLKQINSKLMQNLSTVIDHTMLQEAINQGLVELIPDLTGISEVGEYKLTNAGEEFFANQI